MSEENEKPLATKCSVEKHSADSEIDVRLPIPAINCSSSPAINHITTNAPLQQQLEAQLTPGRQNLRKWLGKTFRVVITDGRVLVGIFNCTDKDANIVLSMCAEYLEEGKDARILGNVMIPGKHIVSIAVDMLKEDLSKSSTHTNGASAPPFIVDGYTIITPVNVNDLKID